MSNTNDMEILDHLDELRKRLIICVLFILVFSIISYIKSDEIIDFLRDPLGNIELVFITPTEGFMTKLKVAFFGGVVLSSPIIFTQTVLFVSPGLYKKEKILLFSCLPFIIGLFLGGIYFCFRFILPTTLNYLMSFGGEFMSPMISVNKYFSFVIVITLGLGLLFELPMVMLLLSRIGIINHEMLSKKRKYAMFIIVVIAAIITPTPDMVTLLAVSVPLIVLYELSLWLILIFDKILGKGISIYEEI
jgi:sec-independent protein translocase protein TatC